MKILLCNITFLLLFINSNASKIKPNAISKESFVYTNYAAQKIGLSKNAFDFAIKGYSKLIAKNELRNIRYLTICDFTKSSTQKRFFILDLVKRKIIYNLRVAHGKNSGAEYATKFSNKIDSHQSSIGFYKTHQSYIGDNGISLQLIGLEKTNSNALERAIVLHGSDYLTDAYYKANKSIGRSWGCPAISKTEITKVVNILKNGSCFLIYYS
jgi:hypothetical protein